MAKLTRLFKLQDGKCFYCKCEVIPPFPGQVDKNDDTATRDHVIAKSKLNKELPFNVIMACNSCNSLRGNMEFIEFVSKIGYFIK